MRKPPARVFTRTTYRQAYPFLALDFENRCAYSMQHVSRAGGEKCMEVDHFNPHKKDDKIQEYDNLFLATRHSNGSKRDRWPTNKDQKQGIRFLNCCREMDYGVHIFEDPNTHELVGVTSEGRYHIRNCDLNAPHLVAEREQRTKLWRLLDSTPLTLKVGSQLPAELEALKAIVSSMIPRIPFLSGEALKAHRARKLALESLRTTEIRERVTH